MNIVLNGICNTDPDGKVFDSFFTPPQQELIASHHLEKINIRFLGYQKVDLQKISSYFSYFPQIKKFAITLAKFNVCYKQIAPFLRDIQILKSLSSFKLQCTELNWLTERQKEHTKSFQQKFSLLKVKSKIIFGEEIFDNSPTEIDIEKNDESDSDLEDSSRNPFHRRS